MIPTRTAISNIESIITRTMQMSTTPRLLRESLKQTVVELLQCGISKQSYTKAASNVLSRTKVKNESRTSKDIRHVQKWLRDWS